MLAVAQEDGQAGCRQTGSTSSENLSRCISRLKRRADLWLASLLITTGRLACGCALGLVKVVWVQVIDCGGLTTEVIRTNGPAQPHLGGWGPASRGRARVRLAPSRAGGRARWLAG